MCACSGGGGSDEGRTRPDAVGPAGLTLEGLILSEIKWNHGTCFAPQLKSSGGVPVAVSE